jgi:hypothetical protein
LVPLPCPSGTAAASSCLATATSTTGRPAGHRAASSHSIHPAPPKDEAEMGAAGSRAASRPQGWLAQQFAGQAGGGRCIGRCCRRCWCCHCRAGWGAVHGQRGPLTLGPGAAEGGEVVARLVGDSGRQHAASGRRGGGDLLQLRVGGQQAGGAAEQPQVQHVGQQHQQLLEAAHRVRCRLVAPLHAAGAHACMLGGGCCGGVLPAAPAAGATCCTKAVCWRWAASSEQLRGRCASRQPTRDAIHTLKAGDGAPAHVGSCCERCAVVAGAGALTWDCSDSGLQRRCSRAACSSWHQPSTCCAMASEVAGPASSPSSSPPCCASNSPITAAA